MSQLLSVSDVAKLLRLSPGSVYALITRDGLPGRKIAGQWRFIESEVRDWIAARLRACQSEVAIEPTADQALPTLLVVDDCEVDRELYQRWLRASYLVVGKRNAEEAIAFCTTCAPACVLLDYRLADADGLEVLQQLAERELLSRVPVVVITGLSDEKVAVGCMKIGAADYLIKGEITADRLMHAIANAREKIALRRELEEKQFALEEALREAERASVAKSQFLANMSHEIRTPLTAVIGFGEMLTLSKLSAEDRAHAGLAVVRNGRFLLQIINDILDFSKMEVEKVSVNLEPISPLQILDEVTSVMTLRGREKGVGLHLERIFPLPAAIHSDGVRLKQVLFNLISNALKFTEKGTVNVKVRADIDSRKLFFEVQDCGIGIEPSWLDQIFEPFQQADASITRKFGGTGLGLSISRQLAHLLGADISVESHLGVGSTFTLALGVEDIASRELLSSWLPVTAGSVLKQESVPYMPGAQILLVEDGPDNQDLVRYLLRETGAHLVIAENGQDGVDMALAGNFDLVLMDLQMPLMDGVTAVRMLRQRGFQVPVVALTASVLSSNLDESIEAGCSGFLSKPFSQEQFYALLAKYLTPPALRGGLLVPEASADTPDPFAEVVAKFVSRLPERAAAILSACEGSRWQELSMLAHKLAGADMFGFSELGGLARQLEQIALSGSEREILPLADKIIRMTHEVKYDGQSKTPIQ